MGMTKTAYEKGQLIGSCIYVQDCEPMGGSRAATFKCRCGEEFNSSIYSVKSGRTVSCGCIKKAFLIKFNTKHGQFDIPEYKLWHNMRQRCKNKTLKHYHHYGGRGITVCERWDKSFEDFISDMGRQPAPRMGIDRIDVNGNYEPSNCRWATQKTQNNNRRNNRMVEYRGITQTLTLWCEKFKIPYTTLKHRITRKNVTVEQVFDKLNNTVNA